MGNVKAIKQEFKSQNDMAREIDRLRTIITDLRKELHKTSFKAKNIAVGVDAMLESAAEENWELSQTIHQTREITHRFGKHQEHSIQFLKEHADQLIASLEEATDGKPIEGIVQFQIEVHNLAHESRDSWDFTKAYKNITEYVSDQFPYAPKGYFMALATIQHNGEVEHYYKHLIHQLIVAHHVQGHVSLLCSYILNCIRHDIDPDMQSLEKLCEVWEDAPNKNAVKLFDALKTANQYQRSGLERQAWCDFNNVALRTLERYLSAWNLLAENSKI
mgnify:CR=1 FL=1